MADGPQLPDDLWGTDPPPEVPPAAAVHLRHRGPFNADGRLSGNVAGLLIGLTLQLPWPFGSAEGVLGDDHIAVTWNLRTSEAGPPKTLQGTIGDQPVNLEGMFRLRQDYLRGIPAGRSLVRGTVQGTFVGSHLAATVAPIAGPFGEGKADVAIGTLGDHQFEILAARNGRPMRGEVATIGHFRGTYNGQTVHLDLTSTEQFGDTDVTGAFPAPPAFSALLIAALLFFA